MEQVPASQSKEFFEAPPQPGTPEFDEAKKEAGVVDWFGAFAQKIEMAQKNGDKVLLENSVRMMEEDASRAVGKAMETGDVAAARTVLNEIEKISNEHGLDVKEILASQRERIVEEKLDELKEMGVKGVLSLAGELLRSDEKPFDDEDGNIIFGMMQTSIKNGKHDTIEDALIEAAQKRYEARPTKPTLFVAVDKAGYVTGSGRPDIEAARKFRQTA